MRSKGLSESVKNGMLENSEVEWAAHRGKQTNKTTVDRSEKLFGGEKPRAAQHRQIKKKAKEEIKKYKRAQYEKGRAEARRSEIPGGQGIEP